MIAYFKVVSSMRIDVNWASLEAVSPGIRKVKITVELRKVTVEEALQAVLKNAGGKRVQLGYVVDKGIVKIDTQKKLDANAEKTKKTEKAKEPKAKDTPKKSSSSESDAQKASKENDFIF